MDCVFCKMVAGEIKPTVVYEDDIVYSFLDLDPATKGHILVIPKKHFRTLVDIPDDIMEHLSVRIKYLAKAIKEQPGCEGYNIIQNNESAAGQVVFHAHFHIIPRYANDGYKHMRAHVKYEDGEPEEIASKIKSALKK